MSDLQELTNKLMQDPDFRREYEALQPERYYHGSRKGQKGSRAHADTAFREDRGYTPKRDLGPDEVENESVATIQR